MARKKPPPESTCRHASCRQPIFYNDFIGAWCHLATAMPSCGLVAEPVETPKQQQFSAEWGVTWAARNNTTAGV